METLNTNLRDLVEDLRKEWKLMWWSRIEDEIRAESIADKDYERLFVDRGLILSATRDFKPPEFREILEKHLSPEEVERVNPSPIRGGIRKFIKEHITANSKTKDARRDEWASELEKMKRQQQPKHGGRGWLHWSMLKTR